MGGLEEVDGDTERKSSRGPTRKPKSAHRQSPLWQRCIRRRANDLAAMNPSQEPPPARAEKLSWPNQEAKKRSPPVSTVTAMH